MSQLDEEDTDVDEAGVSDEDGEDQREQHLEFADTVEIQTDKQHLWDTISKPETLTKCVPGADAIERVSERKYTLEISRGVSHLTVSLSGEAEFVEMNPPDSIVTTGSAFDSKTGSDFDILAAMEITDVDDSTAELAYTAEVDFTGGVALMNARVLRPIVERDVNKYFDNVKSVVEND